LKLRILLAWTLVLVWMSVIFFFSAQPGTESAGMSTTVAEFIVNSVGTIAPDLNLDLEALHLGLRKGAHFSVYMVLAVLTANAGYKSGFTGVRLFLLASAICILYAISDEVHQLYVPGRSGELRDVLIDSSGAITGSGLYLLAIQLFSKSPKKQTS